MNRFINRTLVASIISIFLVACSPPDDQSTDLLSNYQAEIRWTTHGIPHIKADNWANLGYGFAYAVATNGICVMAEEFVTVKGERALYFGASDENVHSDTFHRALLNDEQLSGYDDFTSPNSRAMDEGYVAGYNHFIEQNQNKFPERCKDAPWVKTISNSDIVRLTIGVSIRYGLGRVTQAIATASPNANNIASTFEPDIDAGSIGSNALAFGRDLSANGRGLLLGNPHYPWHGGSRFHIAHLTIPGEVDVMGAGLLTTPRLGIGFTNNIAWTHTVSTALRFTLFRFDLVKDDPLAYKVGDKVHTIKAIDVKVDIGEGEVSRTVYMTHLGPVVSTKDAPWNDQYVYAMRDVNYENFRSADLYKDIPQAQSVEELKQALGKYQGAAFVNTVAADRNGDTLYADMSAIPNVSAELITRCSTGQDRIDGSRMIVLNGSDPNCNWQNDDNAAAPGLMPPHRQPSLINATYVSNSNDSHWLTNPDQPLEGYSPIIGNEKTVRGLRTRAGLQLVNEILGTDKKFDTKTLQGLLFNHRNYGAEVFLDEILLACDQDGEQYDLNETCEVLANWDRRQDVDSVGAHIYDEFWVTAFNISQHFKIPFDVNDPVNTPRGLTIDNEQTRTYLLQVLASVRDKLNQHNVALDAPWGKLQYAERNGEKIGIPGGFGNIGIYSVIGAPFNPETQAYSPIVAGNSYIQVVTWNDDGTPNAEAILTYSQSPEPDSNYYSDMTKIYSNSEWVKMPFTDEQIESELINTVQLPLQ